MSSYLSPVFLAPYATKRPDNAGVLFEVVYLRTYSRWLEEHGRRERWDETIARVVEYSMSLYQGPATHEELVREAEELYDHMFHLRIQPAGRTLFVGGTEASRKFPEANFNCLSGETEFLTREGYRQLDSFQDGDSVTVLNRYGHWTEATVRKFNQSKLFKITLSLGRSTREIYATANHRWLVKSHPNADYCYQTNEETTDTLQRGHLIPTVTKERSFWKVESVEETDRYEEVWCVQEPKTQSFCLSDGIVTRNCSFIVIDGLHKFSELFHMLLCGSGVGFRIKRVDVAQIPQIPSREVDLILLPYKEKAEDKRKDFTRTLIGDESALIRVGDSKDGWVDSLRDYFKAMMNPDISSIVIDFDDVRPKGSRIKTFGGRAAGHEGLEEMFRQVHYIIDRCKGHIKPLDALDICCTIALNVVVGGTRRSSLIGLGDSDDQQFIDAKLGLFTDPEMEKVRWRVMSNNSCVFEEKPSKEKLEQLFQNILHNGEPGFFNLEAAKKRRSNVHGINPCVTEDTWITTTKGPRQVKDLVDRRFKAVVGDDEYQATGFWETGIKKVYLLKTKEGHEVKLTGNHKVLTRRGWVEAKDLLAEDKIIINQMTANTWNGSGTREEGWILGSMVGDGCLSDKLGHLRFWGDNRESMSQLALATVDSSVSHRQDLSVVPNKQNGYNQVACVGIKNLAVEYGLTGTNDKVTITPQIEQASSDFYRGYLQALFDADGTVAGLESSNGTYAVRLCQSNYRFLVGIQRMLLRLGIYSVIYNNRHPEGYRMMPDGKGGQKEYWCKATHELHISKKSIKTYSEKIGFSDPSKLEKLTSLVQQVKFHNQEFIGTFESLELQGKEMVYDCTVDQVHRFDGNGMILHNCAEILLDDRGVCNLATVIVPSFMTTAGKFDSVLAARCYRLATRVAMRMTNVTLSMPEWDFIQKRDRLTGISMTGWCDAMDELGISFTDSMVLAAHMADEANREADSYAEEMGIPRPVLVTAIKPEGTISQLPTVSSGMHRAYAPYYKRRIRVSSHDPVCMALQKIGVPNEPDHSKPDRIVFSFPIATKTTVAANDEPAVDQLARYHGLMENYCDHNVSCTLTFSEEEVPALVDAILENWDNTVAIALLNKVSPPYPQMPYEALTKEQYDELSASFPWDKIANLGSIVNRMERNEPEEDELEQDPMCAGGLCPIR